MESIYEAASRSSQVVCAEFRGAFQLFDRNKDGFISCKELSVVVVLRWNKARRWWWKNKDGFISCKELSVVVVVLEVVVEEQRRLHLVQGDECVVGVEV